LAHISQGSSQHPRISHVLWVNLNVEVKSPVFLSQLSSPSLWRVSLLNLFLWPKHGTWDGLPSQFLGFCVGKGGASGRKTEEVWRR